MARPAKRKLDAIYRQVWKGVWSERDVRRAAREFLDLTRTEPPMDLLHFAETNWDTSYDNSSYHRGLIRLYPWQREVLADFQRPDLHEYILKAPSRTAKTTLIGICMSWLGRYYTGNQLLMLENVEKAKGFVSTVLVPIMSRMPYYDKYLSGGELKRRSKGGVLSLPNGQLMPMGGGVPATQFSAVGAYCDEVDRYKTHSEGEVSTVESMRLRTQTYPNRKIIISSTPGDQDEIERYWRDGSQGTWHVRCLECSTVYPSNVVGYVDATGRACGLQWRKDGDGEVVKGSVRWHCPGCRRQALESEAEEMNRRGCFVHRYPDRATRSYTLGCLALYYIEAKGAWYNIASTQERSGRDATLDARKYWSIEFLGKAFKNKVREGGEGRDKMLRDRITAPGAEFKPILTVAGIDTQYDGDAGKKYWKFCSTSVDSAGRPHVNDYLRFDDIGALEIHIKSKEYFGRKLDLVLMDVQGTSNESRADDMMPMIRRLYPLVIGYVGSGANKMAESKGWAFQSDNRLIIHCLDKKWQELTLESIYVDVPERLSFSNRMPPDFFAEMMSMSPPKAEPSAEFRLWKKSEDRNDAYDCVKMSLIAKELVAQEEFMAEFPSKWAPMYRWNYGIPDYIVKRIKEKAMINNGKPDTSTGGRT